MALIWRRKALENISGVISEENIESEKYGSQRRQLENNQRRR
jgi:hypothetical protein